MKKKQPPNPASIMQYCTGIWATALLGAGASCAVFTHIQKGARTVEAVAKAASLPVRSAQALLDGLVALGLVRVARGKYANSPEAATFLVEGRKESLLGFVKWSTNDFRNAWATLPETLKTPPQPDAAIEVIEDNPLWHELVPAIAPLAVPVAQKAVEVLKFGKAGAASILDVGGGSGMFTHVMLAANRKATGLQVDWAGVNAIAREFAGRMGVAGRFRTHDGDIYRVDYGISEQDVIIYSHIAHQATPATNRGMFTKFHRALKSGGALLVNDFIVNDDRSGPPFPLLFNMNMVVHTSEGGTYTRAEYRAWLEEAGFEKITFHPTAGPATLVVAR